MKLGLVSKTARFLVVFIIAVTPFRGTFNSQVMATPGVDDYPYAGQSSGVDQWGFIKGNCTSFVAWRLNDDNGFAFGNNHTGPNGQSRTFSDAKNWGVGASEVGYPVNMTPAVGAVAWWAAGVGGAGSDGHVAWVKAISGGDVEIEEYNWGTKTFAHGSRTIATSSVSGYIHFDDIASGAGERLAGDFNGDGLADVAVMFKQQGAAKVALSTGSAFGYPGDWSYGHSNNAHSYYAGDVNGDGRDDLAAYFNGSRTWNVSLSSGSGFWSPTEWAYDGSLVPEKVFFGDVNGDGKDDKVMFIAGTWYVSSSSGSGFWSPQAWISGHGVGSNDQRLGDFNGDGLADAAIYMGLNGKWYVSLSTGSAFGYPGEWSAGHGDGTMQRLVGDATGDGKDDIAYYSNNIYKWWVGSSSGSGFWGLSEWSYDGSSYAGATNSFLSDVNGDGKDDKILFYSNTGNWYVGTSSGGGFWSPQLWIAGHGAGS